MNSRQRNSGTSDDQKGNTRIPGADRSDKTSGLSRLDFLEALFGRYFELRKGFIMVKSAAHRNEKASTRHFPKIEPLAKESFPGHHQVFFGVCPRENVRAGPESIAYCTALWTTLEIASEDQRIEGDYFSDDKTAARAVRSFPLRPSIIVESGRSLHLYWVLKRPTKVERASQLEELLNRIHKYFIGSQPLRMDAMLRLPDTEGFNELGAMGPCKVKFIGVDFSYSIEEMRNGLVLIDRCRREVGL